MHKWLPQGQNDKSTRCVQRVALWAAVHDMQSLKPADKSLTNQDAKRNPTDAATNEKYKQTYTKRDVRVIRHA